MIVRRVSYKMDLKLSEKRILVTGASKGLGLACAKALASEGANIILVSRSQANLEIAKSNFDKKERSRVELFVCDLSRLQEIEKLYQHVVSHYGPLDGLVINAGGPPPGSALEIDEETWAHAINTNLLSVIRLCRLFVPAMVKQQYGRIIAITSSSAKQPIDNLVLSNTTRLGVIGYLKTLSNEVSHHNVLLNILLPGPTRTKRLEDLNENRAEKLHLTVEEVEKLWIQQIPMKRLGCPSELATFATFLLSPKNSYITGQSVAVDGGYVKSTF